MYDKKTTAIICVFLAIGLIAGYLVKQEQDSGIRKDAQWYRSHVLYQSGVTRYNGTDLSYNLVSVDGGEHWAARDRDGSFMGDVEDKYPGLKEQLEAWDAIMKYVERSEPWDPSNETQMKLLRKAGINISLEENNT